MTKKETIQALQSIEDRASELEFPNLTECDWVAIAAAKRYLTEEPISDNLIEALTTCSDKARLNKESPFFSENDYEQGFKDCYQWQKQQNTILSKDLDELIHILNKRYPEVSFAKLSRIAVQISRWQKQKDDEALDFNALLYAARQEGVEQGKSEMINKACEWLKESLVFDEDNNWHTDLEDKYISKKESMLNDFRKAMEE